MIPGIVAASRGSGGGGYTAAAVHFDGSAWLARATLTGVTDSAFISSSHWVKRAVGAATYYLYDFDPAGNEAPALNITVAGGISFVAYNGTDIFLWNSDLGVVPDDGLWHSILVAVDTNHAMGDKVIQVYVDDVAVIGTVSSENSGAFSSTMAAVKFAMPDTTEDQAVLVGDLADVWIAPDVFVDFTVDANRRFFIAADGKPVDPSGFPASAVLFSGDATGFATNLGTGGSFTLTGSLTNASTSPSG